MFNRRLTGFLAWAALAVVIGVPSSEVLFSNSDATNASGEGAGFFGPISGDTANVDWDGQDEKPAAEVAETPTIDPQKSYESISSPIRLVGDPGMAQTSKNTSGADKEQFAQSAGAVNGDVAPLLDSQKEDYAEAPKAGATPTKLPGTVSGGAETETLTVASTGPVAPMPMPASMRPATPDWIQTASLPVQTTQTIKTVQPSQSSFEDEVAASIANARAQQNSQVVIYDQRPTPPADLGYNFPEDEGTLEPYQNGEFYEEDYRDDYAGDSQFYQQWQAQSQGGRGQPVIVCEQGSNYCYETYPSASQQGGIRLDLLQ